VHAPLGAAQPRVSSSIAYQVRSGANPRLWVVNPDQDNVTVFDAVTRARSGIIATGKGPRSIAIAPDGRAWVVNSESGSITIIGTNLVVAQTVPLPRGSRPHAIVFDLAGASAYVSLQDSGEVLKINPASPRQILATAFVGQNVRHLSVSADGGKIFASRFITPRLPGEETASVITQQGATQFGGEVVVITAASMSVAKTIILEHSNEADSSLAGRGIPNYLGPAVLSPDGISAWVPSKKDNIKRGMLRDGKALTHESAVRSITSRIDLTTESEDSAARIDFNDAGIASTAAFDPTGMYLFTALEGSREIAVVDSWGEREMLRFTAGRAPQGVVTSPDGRTLYVHNFMDRSVTVHDVSAVIEGAETAPELVATLNCIATEKLPAAVLKGKQFFYDSLDQRIALQKYVSCAACHNDGDQDGRVWDFTGFGEGLRNNISLKGHGTHGPVHWTGNFDEIQDFEGQMRSFAGGLGLMSDADFHTGTRDQSLGDAKAGVSADLDALAAYVTSLTTTGSSPFRAGNGTLTPDAIAGQQIFRAQNCAACHSGTRFTNSALNVFANVGTIKPDSGQRMNGPLTGLDVPTLRGLWNTAPYLHDGSAATLADAVRAHQGVLLTASELSKVVAFLSQIDDAVVNAPSPLNVALGTASPTVNGSFPVAGQLSEAASGFTADDIRITGGTISSFSITGTRFSFHVEPSSASVRIEIAANVMTDLTGLGNLASNVLTITNIGGLPSTTEPPPVSNPDVQPHVFHEGGDTTSPAPSFVPVTAFAARVNFQNVGAPTPNGYVADNGAVFAARNGMQHGWNMDHTLLGRDRNSMHDQHQDTFIRMQAGAKWEIAVPNGEYDLVISVGDATLASKNTLRAEGLTVWSAFACTAGTFQIKTVRVIVADGRLTLDNGSAAALTTALNFIDIASTHGTLPTVQNGLSADYYAGTNFDQLRFSRTDSAVDFRWNGSAPDTRVAADNFSVCWHGFIIPRHSERHTFTTMSDDGVRLWVNGRLLIDNWTHHSEQTNTAEIDLVANVPVTIQMEYFEGGGNSVARLLWESASQPREIVPAERLLTSSGSSYPSTFAAWIESGRSNGTGGQTSATTNGDGDDLPDLLEYALGGSAGSGIHAGEYLRLDTQNGHVNASIIRPQGIRDLHWFLESSVDLKTWTFLVAAPVVLQNADGTETLRWENLDTAAGQSLERGIVRLKVQSTVTHETATGKPVAWQQLTVQKGVQTVGMNLVNAPVFSGLAHSTADNVVYLADASYLPGVFDPDARYYLEIRDGAHAGHHFDLSHVGDRVLLIDTESSNNTLDEIPADIADTRIAIHKHVTLGQVFDKNLFSGSTNPSTADQVLFSTPSGFRTFWLLKGGSYHQWNAAGDATLTNADATLIPPGTGVLLKTGNAAPRTLIMTGEVRTTPLARLVTPGFNLFANPWPLDATPVRLEHDKRRDFHRHDESRHRRRSFSCGEATASLEPAVTTAIWFFQNHEAPPRSGLPPRMPACDPKMICCSSKPPMARFPQPS
jgi:DNA-binding beta-propeller fold protein YncE